MDKNCEQALMKILDVAKMTKDGFVYSVDIGIYFEEKERVCDYLVEAGYITNLSYHGQKYIRCQITERAQAFLQP